MVELEHTRALLEQMGLNTAAQLLDAYKAYVADVETYCQGKFEDIFGFYRELGQS